MSKARIRAAILSGVFLTAVPAMAAAVMDGGRGPASEAAMSKSLGSSFGRLRGSYFRAGGLVSNQVWEGMGVPGDDIHLPDGNYLVAGCRHHSCDEKAAMVVTATGTMLAAGLIHFPCFGHNDENCPFHPILTMFVKKKSDQMVVTKDLQGWAAPYGPFVKTETKILP